MKNSIYELEFKTFYRIVLVKPRIPRTDYSKIAERYDKIRPTPANIWVSKIIEYGEIDVNCTVLDVGCGTGRFPLAISTAKNPLICALDPSIEMLKQALEKDSSRDILWIRGDGQNLPFRDDVFDCIYMTLVIHHIEDKETALRKIHRASKKSGRCVIMTNSHSRLKKQVISDFPGVIAMDLKRFPTIPYLRKTLREIGYTNIHYYPIQHNEYLSTDEYLERIRKKYISTLDLLSEEEFQIGFNTFRQRVLSKYGKQVIRHSGFDFIVGQK